MVQDKTETAGPEIHSYFTLKDIIKVASPDEGITGFVDDNPEFLGDGDRETSGEKKYIGTKVGKLLGAWKGERGKSWRLEHKIYDEHDSLHPNRTAGASADDGDEE